MEDRGGEGRGEDSQRMKGVSHKDEITPFIS